VLSEPVGKRGFWQVTRGKSENQADHFGLLRVDTESVEAEEDVHGLEGDALVPVDEGMISSEPKPVGCCEIEEIGLRLVVEPISGSVQRGIEETLISKPKRSAMLLDLAGVNCTDHGGIEPPRLLHLASSRMALRYCLAPSS
jgi:hypothetical protein